MEDRIKSAAAELFAGYEETPQLNDFREEVTANTLERARDLIEKGMGEDEAAAKVIAELGDLAEIAELAGMKKRREIISGFFSQNKPLDKFHAVGYAAVTAVAIIGIIATLFAWGKTDNLGTILMTAAPFIAISAAAYTYLGLTQDSPSVYPMKKEKGLLFALAVGLISAGILFGAGEFMAGISTANLKNYDWGKHVKSEQALHAGRTVALPVVIGTAVLIYLGLTMEDRQKPWFKRWVDKELSEQFAENEKFAENERFGLLSGVIWISAASLYMFIGFVFGAWHPGWLVFMAAVTAQLLLQFATSGKK
ncbi:MAG: permease prefix domain 1-containing protein [Oscillospiraceae bacterium]|nr:permease prefix domain 1-containing protein [Oscillospiraceae bacterium]